MAALTPRPHRSAWPLVAALALAVAGCTNPFAPATPEPPDSGGILTDYSTPDALLLTMELALADKSAAGAEAWIGALAGAVGDSTGTGSRAFYAFLDQRVADVLTFDLAPYDAWGTTLERQFYLGFIARFDGVMALEFLSASDQFPADPTPGQNSHTLHRKYLVTNDADTVAIGYVEMNLAKYGGAWHVTRWQDYVDPLVGVRPQDLAKQTLGWRRLDSVRSGQ